MSNHTPGPWEAVEEWDGWWIKAHGGYLAGVNTILGEGEADARLIAAAPELLETLRAIELRTGEPGDEPAESIRLNVNSIVRRALAQAEIEGVKV